MSNKFKTFLDDQTYIPISFIIVLLGCATTFGIMYQKTDNLQDDVKVLKEEVRSLNDKIDKLKDSFLNVKVANVS